MEKKVFVVLEENVSYDDADAYVYGVYTTEEGAKAGMRKAIESSCVGIKDDIEENLEDEDLEGYESFEEYWDEWVENRFQSPSYWLYSDEDSMTITVQILEKTLEQ